MSEFTDYMQVLTQAETLAAFEVALVASVGSAVVPLHELPFEATETRAAAEEAWVKLDRPHWVMIGTGAPLEDLAKLGTALHLLVEEDFRSWAFVLQSGDAQWSDAILAEPDQYREATVMYPVTAVWDGRPCPGGIGTGCVGRGAGGDDDPRWRSGLFVADRCALRTDGGPVVGGLHRRHGHLSLWRVGPDRCRPEVRAGNDGISV